MTWMKKDGLRKEALTEEIKKVLEGEGWVSEEASENEESPRRNKRKELE